jgi:hypothetical protein
MVVTSGTDVQKHYSSENSHEDAAKEGFSKEVLPADTQVPSTSDDSSLDEIKEVFNLEAIDPVLSRKMALVNKAIDEIGMTSFQWKMFFLNGFGYAVDSVRPGRMPLLVGAVLTL